jgi:hypothetical protein
MPPNRKRDHSQIQKGPRGWKGASTYPPIGTDRKYWTFRKRGRSAANQRSPGFWPRLLRQTQSGAGVMSRAWTHKQSVECCRGWPPNVRYWGYSEHSWILARNGLSAYDPERTSQLRRRKTVLLLRLYMRGRYRSPHHSRKYRKAQREAGSFSWIHPSRKWPNAISSVKFLLEPAEMLLQGADG